MEKSLGRVMYDWAFELFPIHRSLTGPGVRQTLKFIKQILPNLEIHAVPSGTKAFDWTIPDEYKFIEATIKDMSGNTLISTKENNLHVVAYSIPVDKIIDKGELEDHLHSIPSQPDAIPYVTSYYNRDWGFCLSENQRKSLGNGPFQVRIDSKLEPGFLNFGEIVIPGDSKEEILLSTYICHPSMANNELSGPVVSMALINWLQSLEKRKYTYRVVFLVETIGSIYYISRNLEALKSNVKAGWVLTCLGDNLSYSYLPTRNGNTLADRVSKRALLDKAGKFKQYGWLDRGSDERQYCAPGVDLPVASIMRSKYGEYLEYHTSLDNMEFISPEGLLGGYEVLKASIIILETNSTYKPTYLCEPQLGKHGLYATKGNKYLSQEFHDIRNVLTYLDGDNDILTLSDKCDLSYDSVVQILKNLISASLIEPLNLGKDEMLQLHFS